MDAAPLPFGPWWEVFRRLVGIETDDVPVLPAATALSEILQGGHTWTGADAELRRLENAAHLALASASDDPTERAITVAAVLREEGFVGDDEHYEDPRNSYLDRVLERRRGLPITLSMLTVHLGRHAGVPLRGIGFPGHFLVGLGLDGTDPLVLDPFRGGRRLEDQDLDALLQRATGRRSRPLRWRDHLRPVSGREVVVRMLRNLTMHLQRAGRPSHAGVAQLLLRMAATPEARVAHRARD
ncbi:transglutaminase-like domain-containing protein [Paraliomyxa miuraensis]|uniref:transglutaminase-like domain-containing protein n=1 Tax=Paraliomyxa miuraensis TaxID=376150 RepID=UPI0022513BF1|nr:transglutaminase-like domain-containing protein [Paraliomyxa miuraensis]MCX4241899.1 transglutaminase-like domain-containing protein [Paraliomyxa miuraensis]